MHKKFDALDVDIAVCMDTLLLDPKGQPASVATQTIREAFHALRIGKMKDERCDRSTLYCHAHRFEYGWNDLYDCIEYGFD